MDPAVAVVAAAAAAMALRERDKAFVDEVTKSVGTPLDDDYLSYPRSNGKLNIRGFREVDAVVLNDVCFRHNRVWAVVFPECTEGTITIKFSDVPEDSDAIADYRLNKLVTADRPLTMYEDYEKRMLELLACEKIYERVFAASQWWTTFPVLTTDNYEVKALMETPVIVGVSITPNGLLTKYAVETDMTTNPRKLKKRRAEVFSAKSTPLSRRMAGKTLPSRNRTKNGARNGTSSAASMFNAALKMIGAA